MAKKAVKKFKLKDDNMIDASFLIDSPKKTISISPALDIGLSGKVGIGMTEGTWSILAGPKKSGKTSASLQIAANFQEQLGKQVYFGNVEHRIKPRDLSTHNLDTSKVKIIQSSKNQIMSAEDHLNTYRDILKNNSNIVLIIDSGSALCSRDEMDSEIEANRRPQGPKLLAQFCRQMAPVIPIQDNVLIVILHVIANTGIGMSTKYIDGGNKLQYQADMFLECTHFKIKGEEGQAGTYQEVYWKVHTSSVGAPGSKITSVFKYGYGIEENVELAKLAADFGLVVKAGNWYTLPNEEKVNGESNFAEYIKNHKEYKNQLIESINGLLE